MHVSKVNKHTVSWDQTPVPSLGVEGANGCPSITITENTIIVVGGAVKSNHLIT